MKSTVMEASTLIYGHDAELAKQEFLLAPVRKRVRKGDFTRLFLSFHTCGAERIQAIGKRKWQLFCATSTYWRLVLDFCDFFCRTNSRMGDSRKIWFPMGVVFFSRFSQQGVAKAYTQMNSIPLYVYLKEIQQRRGRMPFIWQHVVKDTRNQCPASHSITTKLCIPTFDQVKSICITKILAKHGRELACLSTAAP